MDPATRRASSVAFSGLVLAIVGGAIAMTIATWTRHVAAQSGPPPRLALQMKPTGDTWLFEWDKNAPEIVAAKAATLVIVESSSSVVKLPLTNAQLHAGTLTYTSSPTPNILELRLDVKDSAGQTVSELVLPGPLNRPASPRLREARPTLASAAVPPKIVTKPAPIHVVTTPPPPQREGAGRSVFDPGERPATPEEPPPGK